MTTPPPPAAPAPRPAWPATALPDAIRYVLLGARVITLADPAATTAAIATRALHSA